MLSKNDLKAIGTLLKIQKDEILNEVDTRMDKKLNIKLREQTNDILRGIGEYIQDNLIPLFDDHESRIKHLEKHTDHPPVII